MTDAIELRGIRAFGCHGVLDFEHSVAQPFDVDLVLTTDLRVAGASDDLNDTISYVDIIQLVTDIVANGEHADLIEHLAERIAEAVLRDARITAIEVVVHKPHAPVGAYVSDIAVRIQRP